MKLSRVAILIIIFTVLPFNVFSFGRREKRTAVNTVTENTMETENTVKIRGTVRIFGNTPHTFVGIVSEDGEEYAVYPPEMEEELRRLQGHLIEFIVLLLDEPRGQGSLFLRSGTVTPISWEIIQ